MQAPYGRQGHTLDTIEPPGTRQWFTYDELKAITNGFSHENHIGQGGFGSVYKGTMLDGRQLVAVKQLRVGSGQGEKEFKAEVEIISRVHHRHLVSLVGYCIAEHHRLLVYEYVSNKTLQHHLHGKYMNKLRVLFLSCMEMIVNYLTECIYVIPLTIRRRSSSS